MMNEQLLGGIPNFIIEAMRHSMGRAVDEEMEKAKKRIEERREEIYAGAILRAEKHLSIERMGDTIRIEIKTRD